MASDSCRSEFARDMIDEGRGCFDVDQDRRDRGSDPRDTVEPDSSGGLSTAEAARRRRQFGPNAVVEERVSLPNRVLRHFWAPVPWMLEATIALQLAIGQHLTALLIALLLLLNVVLGVVQESRADAALALLKQRLSLRSRVKRDGAWVDLPAADLVPDDIVQISLGEVVPADVVLFGGSCWSINRC